MKSIPIYDDMLVESAVLSFVIKRAARPLTIPQLAWKLGPELGLDETSDAIERGVLELVRGRLLHCQGGLVRPSIVDRPSGLSESNNEGAASQRMSLDPEITGEQRDVLYAKALELLSGIGDIGAHADIGHQLSDDLRHMLEALGDGGAEKTRLGMPSVDLIRVLRAVRERVARQQRTDHRGHIVLETCDQVLAALADSREPDPQPTSEGAG